MKKKTSQGHSHVKVKKRKLAFWKLFKLLAVLIIVLILGIHLLSSYFLGVSILTLANDALIVSGVTTPSVEEIQDLPIEVVSQNVGAFIEAFNTAGESPDVIELDDGIHGLIVTEGKDIILEGTIEAKGGEILAIDYSGLPVGISDEDIIYMPENYFRMVFSGEIPESFEGALEIYSNSQKGFQE